VSIKLDIKIAPALQAALTNLQTANPAMQIAGRIMLNYLKDYHTDFIPKWKGPHYISGGVGANRFGASVVQAWQTPVFQSAKSFFITNLHPYLAHKITGGEIKPKRVKMLTIPLIAQARGRMAAEFQRSLGVKLFRRGKALSYREGKGKNAKVFNAYALSPGVNQAPWPGAMPKQTEIEAKFVEAVNSGFKALATGGRQL
jgi:hypothetical protein